MANAIVEDQAIFDELEKATRDLLSSGKKLEKDESA